MKTRVGEFADSVDPDEVAHNEPPHLDLHCLPSSLKSQFDIALMKHLLNFCKCKFCHLVFLEL